MTKFFIHTVSFLVLAGTLNAQPLKKILPFHESPGYDYSGITDSSLTMADLQFQALQAESSSSSMNPWEAMQTKPGIALLGSAIIPGLGQAANDKWVRAATYFVADVVLLGLNLHLESQGQSIQHDYENFADRHWSANRYARWLVEYHEVNTIPNEYIDDLEAELNQNGGSGRVDLQVLRNVERNTPFVNRNGTVGNNFSHVLPDYGSQQYYELISKYYQYGPGWEDFNTKYQLAWNGSDMSDFFRRGADMSERFNDKYRLAGNMLGYLLLNHVISAFDALITVKLKNHNRLEVEPGAFGIDQFSVKYNF